jgi:hypothetical protein
MWFFLSYPAFVWSGNENKFRGILGLSVEFKKICLMHKNSPLGVGGSIMRYKKCFPFTVAFPLLLTLLFGIFLSYPGISAAGENAVVSVNIANIRSCY